MLSKKEVEHIAKLARISLVQKEIEKFQKELSSILDYVEKLKEVDIEGITPTSHSIAIENVMREDECISQTPELKKKLIEKFPDIEKGYLKTKSIL